MSGSTADDESGDADLHNPEEVENVSQFISQISYIGSYFEDISQLYVRGESLKARNKLRDFAENQPGSFAVIAYTFGEDESFFEDVRQSFGEETLDDLRGFSNRFSGLRQEITLVYIESEYDQKNPLSSYRTSFHQTSSSEGLLVHYEATSGEVSLVDTKVTVPHVANLSRSFAESTATGIERVADGDFTISADQLDELHEAIEQTKSEIDRIEEALDELPEEQVIKTEEEANE